MNERCCFRWKASSFSVSDIVRPHAPAFYSNTGHTNALYTRNRSCSLTCCLRNQRSHMKRKAVTASLFSETHPQRLRAGIQVFWFACNTVGFTADDCTLRVVDVQRHRVPCGEPTVELNGADDVVNSDGDFRLL